MEDASRCPACRAESVPGGRFCPQCGVQLAEGDAERRHLTVLFCDLADSTALAERLDPEDLRGLVREYHVACARAIAREGGHVSQYLGDGMLVFFGYPRAHEDDAARAVRAALGILEQVSARGGELGRALGEPLALRIGIDSGPVVIGAAGDGSHRETQALGQTMNRAARLQALAPVGGVVVSDATLRLARDQFVTRPLGVQPLKGMSGGVLAHQVLGPARARGALAMQESSRLTPLAGRRAEVTLCTELWRRARDGEGLAVLLEAEAGLGKSRLVRVLRDRITAPDAPLWIECRGAAQHADSALYPVIELLGRVLEFEPGDEVRARTERLARALEEAGLDLAEALPLLAELLSLPAPEGRAPLSLSPEMKRRRTLAVLVRWLVAHAEKAPVVFAVEDLHWVDPSTLDFLGRVVEEIPGRRVLVVGTFRPGFESPWRGDPRVLHRTLLPLEADDVRAMIGSLARGKRLPEEVTRELVARTDGTPIFVEELTKMVLESGILEEREDRYELRGAFPRLAIPDTLQASLTARLDRLAPVKSVAQLAATIGRAFSYELIAAVAGMPDLALRAALRELVAAEILVERGGPVRAEYSFRHALIQEAAYASLLREKRRQLHGCIAGALRSQFADLAAQHPELLAHHLQEAGLAAEAIGAWRDAGVRATRRSAMVEALHHFRRALDLVAAQAEGPERDRAELGLQAQVAVPVIATRGYGTPEASQAIARARELCERLGDAPDHFPVLRGVWTFYEVRAEYRSAHEVALRLVALAEDAQDPVFVVGAFHSIGITNLFLGRFAIARHQLEHAISLYDPERQRAVVTLTPMDPGVGARGFGALARWFEGRPDAALELAESSLPLARRLGPFNVTWALILSGWMQLLRGDWSEALRRAEVARAISEEQGFQNSAALGRLIEGFAHAWQGDPERGASLLREGLTSWRAVGTEMGRSLFLCWYAEACLMADRPSEAAEALREADACVERGPERFAAAEVLRLRGELALAGGQRRDAGRWFEQALEVADGQGAPSWMLRAATSAARLAQSNGHKEAARALLLPVYAGFGEGMGSRDLRMARELLAAL